MGLELLVQVGERHCREYVDPSQQVVLGDPIFEPELVEQPALIPPLPPHHRPALRCRRSISHRNHGSPAFSSPLSTPSVNLETNCLCLNGSIDPKPDLLQAERTAVACYTSRMATKGIEEKIDRLTQVVETVAEHVVGIDERLDALATKEQIVSLHDQVNTIERQLRETKTEVRLGAR